MKHTKKLLAWLLTAVILLAFVACTAAPKAEGIWDDALYTEDTTLGEGAKTVTVKVTANKKTVTFTLQTDAETLGGALLENGLVGMEDGMVMTANGMLADYNINQTYWALYQNDEYMMTGVNDTPISGGEAFAIVHSK